MTRPPRGREAEAAARLYLEREGFEILAANFRSRDGEIDLVCREGGTLVLVEVKERKAGALQEPERAIDRGKINRILKTAEKYIKDHAPRFEEIRIDAVFLESAGGEFALLHRRDFR